MASRFIGTPIQRWRCRPAYSGLLTDPTARTPVVPVKPDSVITAINRYRAASAELDKIAVREPTLPNGNPADETEEYAVWETATHKAQDAAATAWAEVWQHSRRPWPARLR